MRVDIVIAVAERGGPENIIRMMIPKMKAYDIQIRVVQMAWEGYRWLDDGVEFYPLTEGKGGHSPAEFIQKYSELFDRTGETPDLVLAAAWPYMSLVAKQALANRGLDVPVVSWLHSGVGAYARKGFGGVPELLAADAHFAINTRLWEELRQAAGVSTVYRVNNPVEMPEKTITCAMKKLQHTLLFVGRISAEKNIEFLLDAMVYLPEWKLILVGDGEERISLEKHCKDLNLEARVQWIGWQQDPWKYAGEADALVMASHYEGFPLTVIEAQSRGLPVISTRVDGITEFIEHGENGYLYDFGNMETYCDIFSMIQEQGYVVEHPELGRERVREYDSELVFWDMAVKMQAICQGKRLRPNTSKHPYYVFHQRTDTSKVITKKTELLERLSRQRLADMEILKIPRKRVVLFYQDSPYGLEEYMIQNMKQIFLQQGYQVTDVSFSVVNPYSNCDKQLGPDLKDICLVFGMDAVGFEMQVYNGQKWINAMHCLCVSYLYHHAGSLSGKLDMEMSWNIEFHTADRDNRDFVREWYPKSADTKLIPGFAFASEKSYSWQDRIYDIYIPGDYISSQSCQQAINELPEVFQMIAASMMAKMEQNTSMPACAALKQVLEEINFVCEHQEFFALLESLKVVEDLLAMKAVEQLLDAFLHRGLTVAVYGNGWEQYSGENKMGLKRIPMQGKPEFSMHLSIMAQAKCFADFRCFDSESTITHILSAMKNGGVVLSNRAEFCKEYFEDGKEILLYQEGQEASLDALLGNYFVSENRMTEIAGNAYAKSEQFIKIEDYVELLLHMQD